MPAKPKPDEFGRYRVETDTGAQITVNRPPLPHEKVLDEPASDVGGDPLPTVYPGDKKQPQSSVSVPPAGDQKES